MTRRVPFMLGFLVVLITVALTGCGGTDTAPGLVNQPMDPTRVAFLGDSITARWSPLPVAGAINAGVSGETSEQIAARMQSQVIDAGAGVVVILAGTNDILKTTVADTTYVQSMAHQARDAGLRVILATIPPTEQGLGDSMDRVNDFNQELIAFANDNGFEWVDYYDMLIDLYPGDTVDGIHPNAQGYARMVLALDTVHL